MFFVDNFILPFFLCIWGEWLHSERPNDSLIHLANSGWTWAMCKVLNEASATNSTWIYNQNYWALTLRASAYDMGQVSPPLSHGTWNPQERRSRIRNLSCEVLMNIHNITAVNSCSFRLLTLNSSYLGGILKQEKSFHISLQKWNLWMAFSPPPESWQETQDLVLQPNVAAQDCLSWRSGTKAQATVEMTHRCCGQVTSKGAVPSVQSQGTVIEKMFSRVTSVHTVSNCLCFH